MSRTKRKYPTYKYLRYGKFYTDSDDIPDSEYVLLEDEEVKQYYYELEWENRTCYNKRGEPIFGLSYKKRVKVKKFRWVKTGRKVPLHRWTIGNYETIYLYTEKSVEGWKHNNRQWQTQGVGKYNKRLREKKFRAQTRQAINKCLNGFDDSAMFPVNKQVDRWNFY